MSTHLNNGEGGGAPAEGGGAAGADNASGAGSGSAAAAAPAAQAPAPAKTIGAAANNAVARASAKLAAGKAATAAKTSSDSTAAGQAAVSPGKPAATGADNQAGGASTQAAGDGKSKTDASTGAEAGTAGAGSTEAPKDWPQEARERFAKLTEDGRALVLAQYQDMRAGLTRANESLARERDQLGILGQTLKQHSVEPQRAVELLEMSARFEADPQAVLTQLAQQKGIKVHFGDAPAPALAEGEMPEFKTTAEMVQFIENRALQRIRAEGEKESKAREEGQRREARLSELRTQFTAAKSSLPDFASHEQGVFDTLSALPNLSVTQAYRLASFDAVSKVAGEVPGLKAEVATLKTELENVRKRATAPQRQELPGSTGKAAQAKGESPGQRALARAQRRIAEQKAH